MGLPLVDEVIEVLKRVGLPPTEVVTLSGRSASYRPIPSGLSPALQSHLSALLPGGLYSHQAEAMEAGLKGNDVCIATPTASGKSLIFMTAAVESLLSDPSARVIALYPAKALIQDQMAKWHEFLRPFGQKVGFIDGSVSKASRLEILAASSSTV